MNNPGSDPEMDALLDSLTKAGWMNGWIHDSDGNYDYDWTDKGLRCIESLWRMFSDAGCGVKQSSRLHALFQFAVEQNEE